MTNYISLRAALRFVPKPLYEFSNEFDFLSWMLDAYRELKLPQAYERVVQIFEILDNKFQLPQEIKEVNLVTYLWKQPTDSECASFVDCVCNPEAEEGSLSDICRYTLAYRQFLDSPYYNNNYAPLQYKGNSSSILCKECPNRSTACQNTFTIDKDRILHTNLCEGFLCIDYDREVIDQDDMILIPDSTELKQYLAYYACYKHWEERAASREQGADRLAADYLIKAEIYLRKSRGAYALRSIDANSVASIQSGNYNKWIKIPEMYVYAR